MTRIPLPDNSTFPISQGVWVGDTLYLSGTMGLEKGAPPGDTKTQTIAALKSIEKALNAQKLDLGDVVMMHVYLAGDPAKDNKNDFAGFMAGYTQFLAHRRSRTNLHAARCRWQRSWRQAHWSRSKSLL